MAERAFFLNTLHPGVDPADYEQFVRDVDYPFARRLPAIESYVVTRIDGMLEGDAQPPYQYLEVVEITGVEEYRAALDPRDPEVAAFHQQWATFVQESVVLYGETIE
jgi:REDY-like protein HapK